jgi:hypothetical protein
MLCSRRVRAIAAAAAALFAASASAAAAAPSVDAKLPPVSIEMCSSDAQGASNPNLKVGLAFRDLTDVEAVEVQFDIVLLDGSDNVVAAQTKSISGKFSPNILIEPRRAPMTNGLLTQPEYPDSPAWNVSNHFGSGVERVRCELHSVKFADGTSWSQVPKT